MILNAKISDHRLRARAAVVTDFTDLPVFVAAMHGILELAGGLGLAAPQLGLGARVFVLRDWPDGFVNAQVVKLGEEQGEEIEGCLSLPGERVYVRRPTFVKIRSQRSDGQWRTTKHRDRDARAVLHELDHLEGVLISDYIPKPVAA